MLNEIGTPALKPRRLKYLKINTINKKQYKLKVTNQQKRLFSQMSLNISYKSAEVVVLFVCVLELKTHISLIM